MCFFFLLLHASLWLLSLVWSEFPLKKRRIKPLKNRFICQTLPGTQSSHEAIPRNENSIECKRWSEDTQPALMFTFSYYKMTSPLQNLAILHYVACVYDSEWRIGILLSLDHEERDCQIKFVYQTRFTCSFKWSPQRWCLLVTRNPFISYTSYRNRTKIRNYC